MPSRYPPLPRSALDLAQSRAYDLAVSKCQASFGDSFVWRDRSDALVGPFGPLLYVPSIMEPFFIMLSEVGKLPGITPTIRETAILATGSVFEAPYELYAHSKFATVVTELSETQIAAIQSGLKPLGHADKLSPECDVAFDVAIELGHGKGKLSQKSWERAVKILGRDGTLALIQFVSLYAYTCVWLNATAAEVPEGGKA